MMVLAFLLASLAGALSAVLVCKGIKLKLWLDVVAGCGACCAIWAAGVLAGSSSWPLAGFGGGFGAVVLGLRYAASRQLRPDKQW